MIVCSCNVLSDADVRDVASAAAPTVTPRQVYACLGCEARCGRCIRTIRRILREGSPPEGRCR
jgi:bacterioferritin-associated ferredoxin